MKPDVNYSETEIALFDEGTKKDFENFEPYWQKNWVSTCKKKCCFSNQCGGINCSNCGILMAKNKEQNFVLSNRFHCIDCYVDVTNTFELCENCFNDNQVYHPHGEFLFVNVTNGGHEWLTREDSSQAAKELYFSVPSVDSLTFRLMKDGEKCPVCWQGIADFEDEVFIFHYGCGHSICKDCLQTTIDFQKEENKATFKLEEYILLCPPCFSKK